MFAIFEEAAHQERSGHIQRRVRALKRWLILVSSTKSQSITKHTSSLSRATARIGPMVRQAFEGATGVFFLDDLDCSGYAALVTEFLRRIDGISRVEINYVTNGLREVQFREGDTGIN